MAPHRTRVDASLLVTGTELYVVKQPIVVPLSLVTYGRVDDWHDRLVKNALVGRT